MTAEDSRFPRGYNARAPAEEVRIHFLDFTALLSKQEGFFVVIRKSDKEVMIHGKGRTEAADRR